jgi:ribosomal protein L34E
MSASQRRFGAVALKSRSTRSEATRTPCTRIVVLPFRRLCEPESPAILISRSARLRPTRKP